MLSGSTLATPGCIERNNLCKEQQREILQTEEEGKLETAVRIMLSMLMKLNVKGQMLAASISRV